MTNPETDGVDHINVYSKGKTELGRLLSNFAHTPFKFNGKKFESVEGFWYWWITEKDELKDLWGIKAKTTGRKYAPIRLEPRKDQLKLVYYAKLRDNPELAEMLIDSELPLTHYYVYMEKKVPVEKYEWTAKLWEEIRGELKDEIY